MKKKPTYHGDLIMRLKNKRYALGYLNVAYQDSDKRVFLLALRNVAEAWGGMTALSRRAKIPRVSLYRMLSKQGNPEIQSIGNALKALGFRFTVVPDRPLHMPRLKHAA